MMRSLYFKTALCLTFVSLSVFAEDMGFNRVCNVHEAPDVKTQVLCRAKPGDPISEIEKAVDGFYSVTVTAGAMHRRCSGFVTDSCLSLPTFRKIKKEEVQADGAQYQRFQFGPVGQLNLLLTSDPSSTGINTGWGYDLGGRVDIPLARRFRISPTIRFSTWKLSRQLSSSSPVTSPSDTVSQTLQFLTTGLTVGYVFGSRYTGSTLDYEIAGDRTFWTEVGLEYLIPLSANQTLNNGTPVAFSNTDKPLLLVLSAGLDWPLSGRWVVGTHFGAFYNVASTGGSKLFGGRMHLSASYGLDF